MDNVIEVRNLTKRFGSFTAVDAISYEVPKGEIFGFLNTNGAGKTTAIRMLCGLSFPTEGSGTVAGFDIMTQGEQIKRHIGYMSQRFSLYGDLTVFENMQLFGGIYGMSEKEIAARAAELLEKVQFSGHRNDLWVRCLSVGSKTCFLVATVHNPEIVFLDEPTGGVDRLRGVSSG
jgi:ABC-2 type transport system ATP-binding protein